MSVLKQIFHKDGLSNREVEVACLVCQAYTNKKIGGIIYVTEKTVKFHLTNIYKKLGLKTRAELIAKYMPYAIESARKERLEAECSDLLKSRLENASLARGVV